MNKLLKIVSILIATVTLSCTKATHVVGTPVIPPSKIQGKVNTTEQRIKPYVIMISIDGFRSDYLEKYTPPTLTEWAKTGVKSKGIIPSFPSLTFPNHISLVTGRRPGSHGIVGNFFYDEKLKKTYGMTDTSSVNNGSWYHAEPLWITAEKSGMLAATYFWVGSEAKIEETTSTYIMPYKDGVPNGERVDKVIDWLKLPVEKRPHFIGLYFSDVDSMGHKYGPDAAETKASILEIDGHLARLKAFVDKQKEDIEIVVVSDHGMKKVERRVDLTAVESLKGFTNSGSGALMYFYTDDDSLIEPAYKELETMAATDGGFKVYRANELPAEWGMNDVDRRGDLVVLGAPGVYMGYSHRFELEASKEVRDAVLRANPFTHGWDASKDEELHGLFIANGRQFKKGMTIDRFDNIHVYPMVLKLLELQTTQPYEGELRVLAPILVDNCRVRAVGCR